MLLIAFCIFHRSWGEGFSVGFARRKQSGEKQKFCVLGPLPKHADSAPSQSTATLCYWDCSTRSSCCSVTGSAASLQHQDERKFHTRPAQWVKGFAIALAVLWVITVAPIWTLDQELHMPWGSQKRKRKKERNCSVSDIRTIIFGHRKTCVSSLG